jgi:hypothetical protein
VPDGIDTIELRRLLVKAKIVKNSSSASYDDIIRALQFITGDDTVEMIDNEDMTFQILFGAPLSDVHKFVLSNYDVIPRPNGVDFKGYEDSVGSTQFGGDDVNSQFGADDAQFGYLFGGS